MPDLESLKFKVEAQTGSTIAKLNALSKAVEQLKNEIAPAAASASKAQHGIKGVGRSAISASSSLKTLKGTIGGVRTATVAFVAVAYKLGVALKSCVKNSMDFVETMNLFNVSMGDNAIKASKFAEKVQKAFGIDPAEWMRNQGVFQSLIEGFGVASEKADIMSQQVTQLGYDLSSLWNRPVAEAMQKLQSGVAGELEPLRRWGFDLSQAKLQQIAYDHGIRQSVQTMTQAQKVQLRYYAIMTQMTTAHGDMARTILQPANMLRILKQNVTQASRAIGNLLIPIMQKLVAVAVIVVRGIAKVATAIAKLFGIDTDWDQYLDNENYNTSFDDVAEGIDDVGSSAGHATNKIKEFKKQLLGFDKINNITLPDPTSSSGGGGGGGDVGGGGDLDLPLPEYDFLQGIEDAFAEVHPRLQKLFDDLAADFAAGGNHIGSILGAALRDALDSIDWDKIKAKVKKVVKKIAKTLNDFIGTPGLFKSIGKTLGETLNTIFAAQKTWNKAFNWKGLGRAVAESINSFFKTFDVIEAAQAISGTAVGILDTLIEFTATIDWDQAGKKIADFITNIDYKEITIKLITLGAKVLQGIAEFMDSFAAGILTGTIKFVVNGINDTLDWIAQVCTGKEDAEFPLKITMADKQTEAWAKLLIWLSKITTAATQYSVSMALDILAQGPGIEWADLFTNDEEITKDSTLNVKKGKVPKELEKLTGNDKIDALAKVSLEKSESSWDEDASKAISGGDVETHAAVALAKAGWNTVSDWMKDKTGKTTQEIEIERAKAWGDSTVSDYVATHWKGDTTVGVGVKAVKAGNLKGKGGNGLSISAMAATKWIGSTAAKVGVKAVKTGKLKDTTISHMATTNWLGKSVAKVPTTVEKTGKLAGKSITQYAKEYWTGADPIKLKVDADVTTLKKTVGRFRLYMQPETQAQGGIYSNGKWKPVTTAATGGAFNSGQMFIAREAGPELVGTIGRRTAVMNNGQIVSSVAAGVASANSAQNSLLRQLINAVQGGGNSQVVLQVDSTKLGEVSIRSINKVQRQQGRVLLQV